MKLSTEAKAGVMVAVSFLGLGGVLVGKKYLDPDNPITALANENGDTPAKEGDKEKGGDSNQAENSDLKKQKPDPEKKENGNIILAKADGKGAPGPSDGLTKLGDTQGKPIPAPSPFSPFSTGNETIPPLPGTEGKDKPTGGISGLQGSAPTTVKKEENAPFAFPSGPSSGLEKKSSAAGLAAGSSNSAGKGPDSFPVTGGIGGGGPGLGNPPAPAPLPSGNSFPISTSELTGKGSDLKKGTLPMNSGPSSAFEKKLEAPGKGPEAPFGPSAALAAGAAGAAGAGAGLGSAGRGNLGDPLPPPAFPVGSGNMSPGFSSLEKTGPGGFDSTKKGLNDLPSANNQPAYSGLNPSESLRNQPNPRNDMPAGFRPSSGMAGGFGAENSLTNRSAANGLGSSSYANRDSGSSGANPLMGNTSGAGALGRPADESLGLAARPTTKPTVSTFSALTGPAKRTEFIPLEENSEPPQGRIAGLKDTMNPFPVNSGQNLPGISDSKTNPPAAFPLSQGSGRDGLPMNPAVPSGSGPALPPLGRSDAFPSNGGFAPGANSNTNTAGAGTRTDASRFAVVPASPNGPILKMPADDRVNPGSGVQPAAYQFPSGGAGQGNAAMPGGANFGGAPNNAPSLAGQGPGSGNLPSSGAFPGSAPLPAPGAFSNSGNPPAPAAFPVTNNLSSPGPFPGSGAGAGTAGGANRAPSGNMNPMLTPKVSAWSEKVYSSAAGDTWDSIAQKEYQRKEMGRLLQAYNEMHPRAEALPKTGPLPARTEIYLPPAEELIKRGTGEVPANLFPPNRP